MDRARYVVMPPVAVQPGLCIFELAMHAGGPPTGAVRVRTGDPDSAPPGVEFIYAFRDYQADHPKAAAILHAARTLVGSELEAAVEAIVEAKASA